MFANLKMSLAPLILRLGLAFIFLYHGFLKANLRSGAGWDEQLPTWLQLVVAWGEIVGGLLLLAGLLARVAALGFVIAQIGAIVTVTGERSFVHLRGHFGRAVDEGSYRWEVGYEYNFALIAMSLTLIVLGSGHWSLDYLLFHGRKKQAAPAPAESLAVASVARPVE